MKAATTVDDRPFAEWVWMSVKVRYIKVRLATYNIRPGEGCLARQSGMYLYMHSASQRLHSSLALVRSDRVVFRSG